MTYQISPEAFGYIANKLNTRFDCSVVAEITEAVASQTGFAVDQLRGPGRQPALTRARWLVMREASLAGCTVEQIAMYLGGIHHTSVPYGIKRINEILGADNEAQNT